MSAFTLPASDVVRKSNIDASEKVTVIRVTGPTSYDTGGSILDLAAAGLGDAAFVTVEGVDCVAVEAAGGAVYRLAYLRAAAGAPATGRLLAYNAAGEVAGATNLSTLTFVLRVFGA